MSSSAEMLTAILHDVTRFHGCVERTSGSNPTCWIGVVPLACPLWPWSYSGGRTTPIDGRQLGRPPSPRWGQQQPLPSSTRRFPASGERRRPGPRPQSRRCCLRKESSCQPGAVHTWAHCRTDELRTEARRGGAAKPVRDGEPLRKVEAGVVPVGQDTVLDAPAVERKAHVWTAIVERENAFVGVNDKDRTVRPTDDEVLDVALFCRHSRLCSRCGRRQLRVLAGASTQLRYGHPRRLGRAVDFRPLIGILAPWF
jgi:hypothetical protein